MTRPLRILIPGGFYHVTCRGNDRRAIYRDDQDRTVFLEKLRGSLANYQVELHAYVLMANHFHLLVATPKANLSEFIQTPSVASLRLLGLPFCSEQVSLCFGIGADFIGIQNHGKSVREQMRYLERYRWSSLAGYLRASSKQPWVRYDMVLGQVGMTRKKYAEFVAEGIARGYDTPWENVSGQVVLGQEQFVAKIKDRVGARGAIREQPSVREFAAQRAADIIKAVCRHLGAKDKEIRAKRSGNRDARAVAMEMLYRHGQLSQSAIGAELGGLDYTTVNRERKRIQERAGLDKRLDRTMTEIDESLRLK